MLWRVAARFVTGPVAFFLAGVIDITAFSFAAWRARRRDRGADRRASQERPQPGFGTSRE